MSRKDKVNKGILSGLEEMEEDNNIDSNSNINSDSNITIKKKINKSDKHIQRLFYITPELDSFLEKVKKKTGRDKSEIVRLALNHLRDNIEIE